MPIPYAAWTSGTARSRRQFRSLLLPLKAIIRNEPAESRLGDQELVEDLAGARRRADGRTGAIAKAGAFVSDSPSLIS
jgi:hypothetical protein